MSIIKNYVPAKGICKVTFSYPTAEGVKSVQVLGDFNNWDSNAAPKMKKSKDEFSTAIELAAGKTYEFRYLLNDEKWDNDFNADKYVSSPYAGINNSVIIIDAVATAAKATKPAAVKAAPAKKEVVKATKPAVQKIKAEKTAAPKVAKSAPVKVAKVVAAKPVVKKETPAKVKPAVAPKVEKTVATAKPVVKKETPAKAKPAAAPKAVAVKTVKDDLKKIEGIGPKIAELFVAKGIVTFNDLSKAKVATLQTILDEGGSKFKMHNPETWPTQAKLAATGKWDELKKLQDELNAGKKA